MLQYSSTVLPAPSPYPTYVCHTAHNIIKIKFYIVIYTICPMSNNIYKLECGPMPNEMAALPNIGGALCSTPQICLTSTTRVQCSNAAKMRNPLKLAGVPQTTRPISASGSKFTILWGHVDEILLLNKFFSDCRYLP